MKENKYLKALSRIKLNTEPDYSWSEKDKEHFLTITEALEKQIPEKLTHEATKPKDHTCPRCGNAVNVTHPYCYICGQALKWKGVK